MMQEKHDAQKVINAVLWGSLALWLLYLGGRDIIDGDIWFHLAGGRFTSTHFRPPVTDPFSFTSAHRPYISLQWLFQLIVYWLYSLFGVQGLILFRIVALGVLLFLLVKALDLKMTFGSLAVIALVIAGCSATMTVRPILLSLLYLSLLLYIWRIQRHYWLLPLIMLLWVNTQGLFVLGLFVIGAWALEAPRKRWQWLAAGIFACFLNPYGVKGFLFPLLLYTRIGDENVYSIHIQEFVSAGRSQFYTSHLAGWACIVLAAWALFALLKGRTRLSAARFAAFSVLFSGFAFIYLLALRNMPLFAIVAGWMAVQCQPEIKHWQPAGIRQAVLPAAPVILIVIFLHMRPPLQGYPYLLRRQWTARGLAQLADYTVPAGAVHFLQKHNWQGRMFNDFNWGGYLIFALAPNNKVFIDPRLEVHPQEFFSEYVEMTKDPQMFFEFDAEHDFDIALFCHFPFRGLPALFEVLHRHENWQLAYADEFAAVFCKKRAANRALLDNPEVATTPAADYHSLRMKYLHELPDFSFWRLPPVSAVYEKIGIGQVHLYLGDAETALTQLMQAALLAPDVGDIHFLLAAAALRTDDRDLFLRAVDLLWTVQPQHPELHELLALAEE